MSSSARLVKITVTLLTLLMLSGGAQARDFLIEVVLFETVAGRNLAAGGLHYPKLSRSLRLGSEAAAAQGFLPVEQGLTLSENAQSIAQSDRYRLIRHISWRQPGLDAESAIPVRISLGETSTIFLPDNLDGFDNFLPASAESFADRNQAIEAPTINGSIKVRLGRFLHMEVKLVYTDADSAQSFRLQQSRKMRSGELHYIDNPRFGLLTRISRLDENDSPSPANATEEETAGASTAQ